MPVLISQLPSLESSIRSPVTQDFLLTIVTSLPETTGTTLEIGFFYWFCLPSFLPSLNFRGIHRQSSSHCRQVDFRFQRAFGKFIDDDQFLVASFGRIGAKGSSFPSVLRRSFSLRRSRRAPSSSPRSHRP